MPKTQTHVMLINKSPQSFHAAKLMAGVPDLG